MLGDATKALTQMFTPAMWNVLMKTVALAIGMLVVLVVVLFRLLAWLSASGLHWAEGFFGAAAHIPLAVLGWLLAIALGFGLFAGAILLMPAVTSLVGSFFADEIAERVERAYYPADPPGTAVPLWRAVAEGTRTAVFAIGVYLLATPFLLLAGAGAVIFFIATAWLLGRIYFELAAWRFHPAAEVRALWHDHQASLFTAGLFIAAFVSIPILNLATPLFGTALMVHVHKRLVMDRAPWRAGPNLIEPPPPNRGS